MALHFGTEAWLAALFGLVIGSFLNVVIWRLPRMLELQWAAEGAQAADALAAPSGLPLPARLSLSTPGSHCPHCGHGIRWRHNIPVLSYLALRGRCADCHAGISLRYPLVELATAAWFAFCIAYWGASPMALAYCAWGATLLTLALIDWDTTLLPDCLTLPLLGAGLLASALHGIPVSLADAAWGAAGGYLSLWLVYWVFKLATGKEGMGYGDFKLFAALGAWLGWQALVPTILIASVFGLIAGLVMQITSGLREGGYIPFGPFLAGAGCAALVWGPDRVLDSLFAFAGM
ncbi:MAG: prepilin peptidase [Acidovorax sp.]|jgi:leader peptidase (prepilin peptidase)/N-methyltransferase|nr:prepilin peptidase [Acidovorax sp.]